MLYTDLLQQFRLLTPTYADAMQAVAAVEHVSTAHPFPLREVAYAYAVHIKKGGPLYSVEEFNTIAQRARQLNQSFEAGLSLRLTQ